MPDILQSPHYLSEGFIYASEWGGVFPAKKVFVGSNVGEAAPLELLVQQGALFLTRFAVLNATPTMFDLTDYIVRMKIRLDDYAGVVQADLSEGEGLTVGNGSIVSYLESGYFDVLMDAVGTADFDWDAAVYDIFLVLTAVADIAQGGGYTEVAVDVDDGTGKGKITANGGTPFNTGVVNVGNLVRLSGAENPKNNGVYTVQARTDTVLTFEKVIGLGYGSDNANDTTMVASVLTPNEGNAIKLAAGPARLARSVTY